MTESFHFINLWCLWIIVCLNKSIPYFNVDVFLKTTIEALNCFEENTYNLTDTIKSKESYFSNAVKPNDNIWQEEIFETYLGNKSFSWLQLNHCANYCVNFWSYVFYHCDSPQKIIIYINIRIYGNVSRLCLCSCND